MAKKANTIRVHQLAKEIGVDSKVIVAKCLAEDIPGIKDHMTVVSAGLSATIREWFSEGHDHVTAVETTAAVDVTQARKTARKRGSKKSGTTDDSTAQGESMTAVAEPPVREAKATTVEVPSTERTTPSRVKTVKVDSPQQPATIEEHRTAEKKTFVAPEAPAAAPVVPPSARPASPAPVMNVPPKPTMVGPAGPMLQKPTKSNLAGPKVIRVEAADVVPAPRSRPSSRSSPMPARGPRTGRGTGGGPAESPDAVKGGDRGGPAGRRNKRRGNVLGEDTGRSSRSGLAAPTDETRHFDWRAQDLLERENRLNRATGFFRQARRDNLKRQTGGGQRALAPSEAGGKVQIQTPISIKNLSAATGIKVTDILRKLLMSGKMVTINSVFDAEAAIEAMLEFNIELEIDEQKTAEQQIAEKFLDRTVTDERRRSPVVTILGHVDHGKTSLLDRIRNANVAAGEAGGITQATSAFQVPVHIGDSKHLVTFIDTPGHEAFTEMRSRGAKVTDVVVLVVAADDGVMPQTLESINHAKAAGVPIVVALNKIDKPDAKDTNVILGQLAEHELNPVEWGGTTEVIRTSATKGVGIQDLLETLDLQAQILDLKADFGGQAQGTVLEARMEEGRGAVASVIVQQGTLRKGDFIAVGRAFGRIRDIVNDRGQRIEEATPSMPVAFSGINDVPDAGDKFYVVKDLKNAEEAAGDRITHERHRDLSKEKVTLDNIFKHLEVAAGGRKELPLIVKADVQGSLETLRVVLARINNDDIIIAVKHSGVGGINESDISLAEATGAIILGFNVTSTVAARKLAEARNVDIRFYDVIYDLTDDVKRAAEGLLDPELKLEVLGHAEVRDVFKISKVGMIAGCYVTDGVIERNSQIRVTRGGIVVEKDRRLDSLKRFKDDVKEVRSGQECGMSIDGYNDIKTGDVLECYRTKEVRRKL